MVNPQNNNFNDNELLAVLAEIERIINVTSCINVILAGDINCDFSRNSEFVNIVRNFVEQNGLKVFWSHPDANPEHFIKDIEYTFTTTRENITYASTLDHFIGNERMYGSVTEAGVIESPDNHSGHLPIYFKFDVNKLNIEVENQVYIPKPSWSKASDQQKEDFKQGLHENLLLFDSPQTCELCPSMKCDHHTNEIDEYATNICESLDLAAQASLPKAGSSKQASQGGGNAGWNEYVKPFQDESLFVNGLWKAAGSPNNGDLFIMNRNAKMQYKYAVKRLKRATYKI